MFRNVSPNAVLNLIQGELAKNYHMLPLVEAADGTSGVKVILAQELTDANNKVQIKKESFSKPFPETPISVEYSKAEVKWLNPITGKRETYHTLHAEGADMTLEELLNLCATSRELSVLAENYLKLVLITTPGLKDNGIIMSGEYLYSNIVNPEAFKYTSDEVLALINNRLKGTSGDAVSYTLDQIDQSKNSNYIFNAINAARNVEFIKFCKDNLKFAKNIKVSFNESPIQNSQAKPTIVNSTEASFNQIGNESSVADNSTLKSLGLDAKR